MLLQIFKFWKSQLEVQFQGFGTHKQQVNRYDGRQSGLLLRPLPDWSRYGLPTGDREP